MSYSLQELQQLSNNALFTLILKTGVKKVHSFPINWTDSERNCEIMRLDRYYSIPDEATVKVSAPVTTDFESIIEALKDKSPNDSLLQKNYKIWTTKDLDYAKTFL